MKIELDAFTRKRVLEVARGAVSEEELLLELAKDFGQRIGYATKQGLPIGVAYEAAKDNFKRTGAAMIKLAENLTLEMLGPEPKEKTEP